MPKITLNSPIQLQLKPEDSVNPDTDPEKVLITELHLCKSPHNPSLYDLVIKSDKGLVYNIQNQENRECYDAGMALMKYIEKFNKFNEGVVLTDKEMYEINKSVKARTPEGVLSVDEIYESFK